MFEEEPSQTEDRRIDAYLRSLDVSELCQLLIESSWHDQRLRQKLRVAVAASSQGGLQSLREAVALATCTRDFIDWQEAGDYACRLEELARLLEARIVDADPELVMVIEEAISSAEDALQEIDDSAGYVMPAIIGLKDVHLAACNALRPEPVALAKRLYGYQMQGEWDTFHDLLPDYAEALGEEGLAAYRARVEEAWRGLPRLGPEDHGVDWSSERFRVEAAMEAIARHAGDVELLIAVHEKNLSSPARFEDLAKVLRDCGRVSEALSWVQQGLDAFPTGRVDNLLNLAIELELDLGNREAAEQYTWRQFERNAGCEGFFRLLTFAEKVGRSSVLRARALDYLWQQVADDESPAGITRRSRWQKPKRGELVSIFLREGDDEAMWRAFSGGTVAAEHWAQVAEVRGKTHHEEAIALYRRLLPVLVESGSQGSHYEAAFSVVKKIKALREAHGQLGMFGDELAEIRLEWKRKRNFMKLLDAL